MILAKTFRVLFTGLLGRIWRDGVFTPGALGGLQRIDLCAETGTQGAARRREWGTGGHGKSTHSTGGGAGVQSVLGRHGGEQADGKLEGALETELVPPYF